MSVEALELSIREESHQSVMVAGYRFDFSYNTLVDRWFLSVFQNDVLLYGSLKLVPHKNILNFLDVGELILFCDGEITREALSKARIVYIPKAKDEI